jgi:hypothetical protein
MRNNKRSIPNIHTVLGIDIKDREDFFIKHILSRDRVDSFKKKGVKGVDEFSKFWPESFLGFNYVHSLKLYVRQFKWLRKDKVKYSLRKIKF